jgi:hypothetical protein
MDKNAENRYAILTFDLRQSTKHSAVTNKLATINIMKETPIKKRKLPNNIYVGKFKKSEYPSSKDLKKFISKEVKDIFRKCNVNGTIFIFTSEEKWSSIVIPTAKGSLRTRQ